MDEVRANVRLLASDVVGLAALGVSNPATLAVISPVEFASLMLESAERIGFARLALEAAFDTTSAEWSLAQELNTTEIYLERASEVSAYGLFSPKNESVLIVRLGEELKNVSQGLTQPNSLGEVIPSMNAAANAFNRAIERNVEASVDIVGVGYDKSARTITVDLARLPEILRCCLWVVQVCGTSGLTSVNCSISNPSMIADGEVRLLSTRGTSITMSLPPEVGESMDVAAFSGVGKMRLEDRSRIDVGLTFVEDPRLDVQSVSEFDTRGD